MKQFNFPTYRIGRICSIDESISEGETKKLSNLIETEWKNYYSTFIDKFKTLGIKNIRKSNEEIDKDNEETIVLSFPKVIFDVDEYKVKCRNSIAICSTNHNSKIWTKFVLLRQNGKLAYNISPEDVNRFYKLANKKGLGIIDIIFPEYEEATKKVKKIKALKKDYIFEIMATNSNDKTIFSILEGMKDTTIDSMDEVVDNDQYLKAIADYFLLTFEPKMTLSGYKSFIKNNNIKWVGYDTDDYNSIFHMKIENLSTRLTGICPFNKRDYSKPLPSEDATRDLLREMAGIF